MMRSTIACAMALLCLTAVPAARGAERADLHDASVELPAVDFSKWLDEANADPHHPHHHHDAETFPSFSAAREEHSSSLHPRHDTPESLTRDLSGTPMAPLPPAIVAGPLGIALAGWMAYRANRRGGRI